VSEASRRRGLIGFIHGALRDFTMSATGTAWRSFRGIRVNSKSVVIAAATAALLLVGTGSGAKAAVYSFNNVGLSDGGLLNGTLDIEFGGVFGYTLTTSGGSIPALDMSYHFPGFPAPNQIPFGSPTVIQIFPDAPITLVNFTSILQLTFDGDLMIAGPHTLKGGISGPSFECSGSFLCAVGSPTGQELVRYVAADTIIDVVGANPTGTTPLPAALPLFASGLGALGVLGWRRKRKAATFAA